MKRLFVALLVLMSTTILGQQQQVPEIPFDSVANFLKRILKTALRNLES